MLGTLTFLDCAMLAFAAFLLKTFVNRKSTPLPPGPRKLPLIGNLLDMPASQEWLTFAEWGKKWGAYPFASDLLDTVL